MNDQPPSTQHAAAPTCPVCGSVTVQVYDRNERRLFACNKCHTDVIVPLKAWLIASDRDREKSDA